MRCLLLSTVSLFVVPAVALATPDFFSHTHTTPIELKPISPSLGTKLAGVCFLGFGDCGDGGFSSISGDDNYTLDTAQQCKDEGYAQQSCNSVQQLDSICPYNTAYAKGCKCMDNLVTCSEWQKGVGESCNEQYASCVCLDGVSAGQYGCAEYYPAPCSSVCKKAYADNCHIRSDNNSAVYGCMKYWSDCSSKCETPYPDNCRNRTEVIASCPTNATCQPFSDCSSKISSWSCNDGYEPNGNSCILSRPRCNLGDIFYSDNTCVAPSNHNTAKTVLGIVVYVNSDGVGGQIMAPWPVDANGQTYCTDCSSSKFVELTWGPWGVDVPQLTNYNEYSQTEADKEIDSCGNTDILIAAGDASTYPAAWAARSYAPTPETKGKWCLPAQGVLGHLENDFGNFFVAREMFDRYRGMSLSTWTSTEGTPHYAWADFLSKYGHNSIGLPNKNAGYPVYPVMEF